MKKIILLSLLPLLAFAFMGNSFATYVKKYKNEITCPPITTGIPYVQRETIRDKDNHLWQISIIPCLMVKILEKKKSVVVFDKSFEWKTRTNHHEIICFHHFHYDRHGHGHVHGHAHGSKYTIKASLLPQSKNS